MLIYIILALTFGYSMIVAETSIGRMTGKSPVGAFHSFGKAKWLSFGGWINAIIPILIVPYYSVIGGWVIKYLFEYMQSKLFRLNLFKVLGGTNINNLNFGMIKDFIILCPSLAKQLEIAQHIPSAIENSVLIF